MTLHHDDRIRVLLEHAVSVRGFMPDDEGIALYEAGLEALSLIHISEPTRPY